MLRITMHLGVLAMIARIPNWPEADAVVIDQGAGTAVLVYHHDNAQKAINEARFAASNNEEFLLELTKISLSDDSTAVKKHRWAMWLRDGLIPVKHARVN